MTKKQCQTWTAFKAFMANRVLTKEQVEHQQREEYKHLPGILNYHTASPFIRRKIDASRAKEWKKYEVFQAAIPIKGQDLFDLLQRVMLVGCATGVRTDAPTSDLETHSIVAAFAVAEGVPPQSSDIRNAYFQALPIDRIVVTRQPSGGLPGVDPEAHLLIRVPVYGLCDSGHGFWKKVNHDALDVGLKASRIFPAFYYRESNGRADLVLTTHVDDFLWACTESGQVVLDKLLNRFEVGKREIGRLRFCGKQFSLDGKDVLIDDTDNTAKTTYIDIAKSRKQSEQVTTGEERQPRSVVGSLSWISRQARPDILYRVFRLQSSIKGAKVSTLTDANKVLKMALDTKDLKITYRHSGNLDFM
ncbi:GIP [Symbiodinium pilosum]|uniref:GIP protein n=1 Tax=Symbiodinium pilosum TaxID=2952 RepID=A0A812SA69_SYMPI|nr:GIP [Symbiodinium pilosum]